MGPDALVCFDGEMPPWAEEAGVVEIGTGRSDYESIESEQVLPLWAGFQGGFHFDARSRIQSLHPGDPDDNRSPDNPHTLYSAYDEDGERRDVHTCGFTFPYRNPDGDYHDLGFAQRLALTSSAAEELNGERVRLVAEVLDAEGRYARDEVWVVAEITEDPLARDPGDDDQERARE